MIGDPTPGESARAKLHSAACKYEDFSVMTLAATSLRYQPVCNIVERSAHGS
jgi:hypothetical protein